MVTSWSLYPKFLLFLLKSRKTVSILKVLMALPLVVTIRPELQAIGWGEDKRPLSDFTLLHPFSRIFIK